jgi:hypothetical protein
MDLRKEILEGSLSCNSQNVRQEEGDAKVFKSVKPVIALDSYCTRASDVLTKSVHVPSRYRVRMRIWIKFLHYSAFGVASDLYLLLRVLIHKIVFQVPIGDARCL